MALCLYECVCSPHVYSTHTTHLTVTAWHRSYSKCKSVFSVSTLGKHLGGSRNSSLTKYLRWDIQSLLGSVLFCCSLLHSTLLCDICDTTTVLNMSSSKIYSSPCVTLHIKSSSWWFPVLLLTSIVCVWWGGGGGGRWRNEVALGSWGQRKKNKKKEK